MWFLFLILMVLSGVALLVFLVLTLMKKKHAWIGLVSSIGVGIFATIAFLIAAVLAVPPYEDEPAVVTVDSETEDEEKTKGDEQADEEIEEEPEEVLEDITEKTVEMNEEYEINGLHVIIEEIRIDEKYVEIDIKASNETDVTKTFYPSQGEIIIGNKQLSSNFLMNKGDSWGDIHAGVEKSGMFKYVSDDDGLKPGEITEIKLMYGNIYDDEYGTEEFEETINLE